MVEVAVPPAASVTTEELIEPMAFAGSAPCVSVSGPANLPTLARLIVAVADLPDATVSVPGARAMVKALGRTVSEYGGDVDPRKRALAG